MHSLEYETLKVGHMIPEGKHLERGGAPPEEHAVAPLRAVHGHEDVYLLHDTDLPAKPSRASPRTTRTRSATQSNPAAAARAPI